LEEDTGARALTICDRLNNIPVASATDRVAPFDIPQLREIMSYDEMELDKLGDRRTAAFFIISDTDTTYNFIVALAFSQMFNLLCERADNVHGGRLPHHVRVLWDEAANTGQVPNLEKLVAVIRSREVSLTLFYQQFGYIKDPKDKHQLIVDPEAAEIVKKIYEMCLQGTAKLQIVMYLNDHGVPSPTAYRKLKGLPYSPAISDAPMWGNKIITDILRNPIYTGDLVQGRRRVKSYKVPPVSVP
jgi:hypothetical protein